SGALNAISGSFVISSAAASQLVFVQQPSDATAGVAIAPVASVWVTDAFGNNVSGASVTVTLTTGSGVLSGTTTQTSDGSGGATFADLSVDLSGSKKLTASSGTLTSVESSGFNITAAAASQLAFVQQPSDAAAGVAIAPAVTVRAEDSFGNLVPGFSVTMS